MNDTEHLAAWERDMAGLPVTVEERAQLDAEAAIADLHARTAVWVLVAGDVDGVRAVAPDEVGVTIPQAVQEWARSRGFATPGRQSLLLAPKSEAEYAFPGEIASTESVLHADEMTRLRAAVADLTGRESATAHPIAILNACVVTADGDYTLTSISLEEARQLVQDNPVESAVGHASTAELLTDLLGVPVPVSSQRLSQRVGQRALVCKLDDRPAEGTILTREELEAIGFTFKILTRTG